MKSVFFYAYLDITNPLVAWEVAIGRIKSSIEIKEKGFSISLWQYRYLLGYVQKGKNIKFINELKLENIRKTLFPHQVSRLQGVFLFESESDALRAAHLWGWDEGYISKVYFDLDNISIVDSGWITNYLNSSGDNEWMSNYWEGLPYNDEPLYELIVDGIGFVLNKELREKAYMNILNTWPTSTTLLASACCAFAEMSMNNVAILRPSLLTEGNKVKGQFAIDMSDFNERELDIVDAVRKSETKNKLPTIIMPDDKTVIFTLPDLRPWFFEIELEEFSDLFKFN